MAESLAIGEALPRLQAGVDGALAGFQSAVSNVRVTVSNRIEDVEAVWRQIEANGVVSPGQSYDFIKLWISAREIAPNRQVFVVAEIGGAPVALLPLMRRSRKGIRLLTWFPGPHVGCNAPLVDAKRLSALAPAERAALWKQMTRALSGADVLYLPAIPVQAFGFEGLFAELGTSLPVETLYQSRFSSWEECNTTQRSKSRRKHDRQQGERLEALGEVAFEEIAGGPEALPILQTMFRQRAKRFVEMGVADPFAPADIARFYAQTVAPDSGVAVKLHVLRLNGDVVAVRYNIAHGDTLFCLISSMSADPAIQTGSPGKQCLLRVMQTVFDRGVRNFDMGAGFTDEKRHWCNTQTGLSQHYLPLNRRGEAAIAAHGVWQALRARIKANKTLLGLAKQARGTMLRLKGTSTPADEPASSE
jgi:CelD/BcsL family acetyltransferase involved in cellulose biosynthesis